MYIVKYDDTLWLIQQAKQGVSKEDFLLWLHENPQQQAGETDADYKNV